MHIVGFEWRLEAQEIGKHVGRLKTAMGWPPGQLPWPPDTTERRSRSHTADIVTLITRGKWQPVSPPVPSGRRKLRPRRSA